MVGVLLDDRAQPEAVEQVVLALAQVQHDRGAAGRRLDGLQRVLAPAVRLPPDAFGRVQALPAGGQRHPVGHDERGVEAHAELADQRRVLTLVAGQGPQELARPRLGDGPDVLDDLLAAHADAVVGDGDRPRAGVIADPDPQRAVGVGKFGLREQFQAEPVDRVRGVRDQLAQEDLLVAVQRVDHQVQDLDDLRLEAEALLFRLRAHRCLRSFLWPVCSVGTLNQTGGRCTPRSAWFAGRACAARWHAPGSFGVGIFGNFAACAEHSRLASAGGSPPPAIRPRVATR